MKKLHKIKLTVFFGYNGLGYHGMQKVVGLPTIEGVMEEAFRDANMINEGNFGNFKKIGWSRASRTDKGVHAAYNAISLKLVLSSKYADEHDNENSESKGKFGFNRFKYFRN
jgi:tRNA pseudouridine(38-40) synthase